jgi:membrane-bound inhibitor of C-type lysozyme
VTLAQQEFDRTSALVKHGFVTNELLDQRRRAPNGAIAQASHGNRRRCLATSKRLRSPQRPSGVRRVNSFAIPVGLVSVVAVLAIGAPAYAAEARYTCSGGGKLTAKFSPPGPPKGEVTLTFDTGRELNLPQVMSADGGRYANGDIEFWIKGRSATLTMHGVKETCGAQ